MNQIDRATKQVKDVVDFAKEKVETLIIDYAKGSGNIDQNHLTSILSLVKLGMDDAFAKSIPHLQKTFGDLSRKSLDVPVQGQIHLIACRCVLPHLKARKEPPVHRFRVFTRLIDDVPVVKNAQCNNCGLVHRVTDVGRSEITGRDEGRSVKTIDDVKPLLPPQLVNILESNDADVASYEMCEHILQNEEWGRFVVLSSETDGALTHVKILEIMSSSFFRVETEERQESF